MEGKKPIATDPTSRPSINMDYEEQECIDLSIAFTPACSIYLVLSKGLAITKGDIANMRDYLTKPGTTAKEVEELKPQIEIATLAHNNSLKFLQELGKIIGELETEKPKVLIHKPNWGGNNKG